MVLRPAGWRVIGRWVPAVPLAVRRWGRRDAARAIANATFAARQAWLWGEGTTAVASDSTHVTAFDQNIFTEWHSRYRRGKRGVLIYWTVERGGAMAVHSQLQRRQQRQLDLLRMVLPQVARELDGRPVPPAGHHLRRDAGEHPRRQADRPDRGQLDDLFAHRGQAHVARIVPDLREQQSAVLTRLILGIVVIASPGDEGVHPRGPPAPGSGRSPSPPAPSPPPAAPSR